ncbi:MAG: hypothetical protein JSS66_17510 [Armatimonadetes bacterium]|nr:hypothetical protein [Armatimonadota bacterium]
MRYRLFLLALMASIGGVATGQSVLFDFNNIPAHTPLPVDVTVDGINAHLSYQFYGYSIQDAGTMGFTPLLFEGNCIYPNSVYRDDLYVSFSVPLSEFSMLYAPQELACGSSATMRVTAYLDGTVVGTRTAVAPGVGTWPTGRLSFESSQPFNRVVVHYDAPPPTGGDYGVIFLADRMAVSPFGGPTTETLAPLTQAVNLGRIDGGSLNSLAAKDGQSETICKFLVPNLSSPFVKLTLGYHTTKFSPIRIEMFTVARMSNAGLFQVRLSLLNVNSGFYDEALPLTRIGDEYQYGIGSPWSWLTDYVGPDGTVMGRIEFFTAGPGTTLRPCVEIDEATMRISG